MLMVGIHNLIDSCNDSCDQICINTNESFYCSCDDGYELDADNITCLGMLYLT